MHFRGLCLFFCFLSHPLLVGFQYSENLIEALQRADHLYRQSQVKEALVEFENVLLLDEGNQKGLTGVLRCHLRLGNLSEARRTMESVERYSLDKEMIKQLHKQLEEAERVQDQLAAQEFFEEQIEDFEAASKPARRQDSSKSVVPVAAFQQNTPQGRFARAIQIHRKGYSSQAIPLYIEAIMDEPNLLFANDHGLMDLSRAYYSTANKADPRNLKTMFILAWIWEQYSNEERAKSLYANVVEQATKNSRESRVAKAKLTEFRDRERQRLERAATENERLIQDKERFRRLQIANGKFKGYSPEEYQTKGLRYLEEKDLTEAIIHLQGAVRISPTDPQAHYYYAMAQVESAFAGNENGFSIAKRELETTLSLDPDPLLRKKARELLNTLTTEKESSQSDAAVTEAP
jgi:tetratricopeptide (TPR) repeat protein